MSIHCRLHNNDGEWWHCSSNSYQLLCSFSNVLLVIRLLEHPVVAFSGQSSPWRSLTQFLVTFNINICPMHRIFSHLLVVLSTALETCEVYAGKTSLSPELTLVEFISTSAAFHGVTSQLLASLEEELLKVILCP